MLEEMYIYPEGNGCLNSCWMPLEEFSLKYVNDIQGRLLNAAGGSLISAKEIIVVIRENGGKEIPLGKVIMNLEVKTLRDTDGSLFQHTSSKPFGFQVIRFNDVPEKYLPKDNNLNPTLNKLEDIFKRDENK